MKALAVMLWVACMIGKINAQAWCASDAECIDLDQQCVTTSTNPTTPIAQCTQCSQRFEWFGSVWGQAKAACVDGTCECILDKSNAWPAPPNCTQLHATSMCTDDSTCGNGIFLSNGGPPVFKCGQCKQLSIKYKAAYAGNAMCMDSQFYDNYATPTMPASWRAPPRACMCNSVWDTSSATVQSDPTSDSTAVLEEARTPSLIVKDEGQTNQAEVAKIDVTIVIAIVCTLAVVLAAAVIAIGPLGKWVRERRLRNLELSEPLELTSS